MINEKKNKKLSQKKIKCRFCKSENYVKQGYRKTKNRGKIQKYLCQDCKKYFTNDEGFFRMRLNPKTIAMSIDMYLSNLSSRKMRNQLKRHFSVRVSHQTVLNWVYKYVLKVQNYVGKLGYNLGNSFYADETVINREGNKDRFWCCVDWDTRLITGFHYSLSVNPKEAMIFIKKAIVKGKPKFIQTDAGVFYPRAFRKLFYSNKIRGLTIEHKIQNYQQTKIHNYKIETVFMKIKDRVDDFRGLKALWSAPIILTGLVIQHNFIEEHTTISRHPCVVAGQDLDLGDNRWLGLIKSASKN
jgi:transposase-like protein